MEPDKEQSVEFTMNDGEPETKIIKSGDKETVTKKESDIVNLNVGGRIYTTTRNTLSSKRGDDGNFFTQLLDNDKSGRIPCERDEKGRIFIDRSGKIFEDVLDFLRNGEILAETNTKRRKIERELDFFQIAVKQKKPDDTLLGNIPRPGQIFFDLCKEKKAEISKEVDANAEDIERSIRVQINRLSMKWTLHRADPFGWTDGGAHPKCIIRGNLEDTARDFMIKELETRWNLKRPWSPNKQPDAQIEFDLKHFMNDE